MMRISLQDAGKRFNREWIFRHFTYQFSIGDRYAITGANGSGKSTMLQVIAGAILQSEGQVVYEMQDPRVGIHDNRSPGSVSNSAHQIICEPYKFLSLAAPYLELIEEMTANEFLHFHSKFKHLITGNNVILQETGLSNAATKQIRYFSSGMKQRLKLAQAFYSDTPVLLLDEPTTNLDAEGVALYHSLIKKYGKGRLVIVSSNDEQEYGFCEKIIKISDYK